jgi:NitT/TauT family transport system substrate-binding protein
MFIDNKTRSTGAGAKRINVSVSKTKAAILLLATFVVALAITLPGAAKAADTKLKLAVSGLSEGKLALYVAEQQGYFKAAGIDAEILEFKSGGAAVQAFVGNSVDLCVCAGNHVITLRQRGLDTKLLVGLDAHFPNALASRPGTTFTDLKSLKGKKIGITSPGSSTDDLIRWAAHKAGLDPDTDFRIVSVGTGPSMRIAIESGAIDAGIIGNAELIDAELAGKKLRIVEDWRGVENAALNIIVKQSWVDKNPAVAKAFVQAVAKASRLIQTDPAAATAGSTLIFPNRSPRFNQLLAASAARHLSRDGSISNAGFENTLTIVRQADPSIRPVALADVNLEPSLSK